MGTRRRAGSSVLEHVDRSAPVIALKWGRSVVGCELCDSTDRLAGYELKVDGRLVARLCADCAGAAPIDDLLADVMARRARATA